MNNPLFIKVKESVTQWIQDSEEKFKSENIVIETIENTEECLYVILYFGKCLAGIVVAEPEFAPFRFISFEAPAIENNTPTMVHTWYDEEGTTIEEIITNLNNAIDIVAEYNRRLLSRL